MSLYRHMCLNVWRFILRCSLPIDHRVLENKFSDAERTSSAWRVCRPRKEQISDRSQAKGIKRQKGKTRGWLDCWSPDVTLQCVLAGLPPWCQAGQPVSACRRDQTQRNMHVASSISSFHRESAIIYGSLDATAVITLVYHTTSGMAWSHLPIPTQR
jgi:hypothetical protein